MISIADGIAHDEIAWCFGVVAVEDIGNGPFDVFELTGRGFELIIGKIEIQSMYPLLYNFPLKLALKIRFSSKRRGNLPIFFIFDVKNIENKYSAVLTKDLSDVIFT